MAIYNYLIAVGGSGIKTLEALIHLSAIGYLQTANPINVAVIDMDVANKNLERTSKTLAEYIKAQAALNLQKGASSQLPLNRRLLYCATRFQMQDRNSPDKNMRMENLLWSPVADQDKSLLAIFGEQLTESENLLMRTLYTDKELGENLSKGFRGRPAIGSLLFAKNFELIARYENLKKVIANQDELNHQLYWSRFFGADSNLKATMTGDNQYRIMVVGSLFGGTGASGIPTIIMKLQDFYKNEIASGHVQLGIVPLLPYFGIAGQANGQTNSGELMANCQEFIHNSRYALQYYNEIGILESVRRIYLFGSDFRENLPFGIDIQKNRPLFVELVAALGISQFLTEPTLNLDDKVVFVRRDPLRLEPGFKSQEVRFAELPENMNLKTHLHHYLRFAVALLHYHRRLQTIFDSEKQRRMQKIENWYTLYFKSVRDVKECENLNSQFAPFMKLNDFFMHWLIELLQELDNAEYCPDGASVDLLIHFFGDKDPMLDIEFKDQGQQIPDNFLFRKLGMGVDSSTMKSLMLKIRDQTGKTDLDPFHHFCNDLFSFTQVR